MLSMAEVLRTVARGEWFTSVYLKDDILRLLPLFREGRQLCYVEFLRLLGKLTAAATVVPLGLLWQVAPAQDSQGVMPLPSSSGSVEGEIVSSPGHAHGFHCIPSGNHQDRCLPLGVRCRVAAVCTVVASSVCTVAASSRGGSQHLGRLQQGRGGSLCHRGVDPFPPLVLLDRG